MRTFLDSITPKLNWRYYRALNFLEIQQSLDKRPLLSSEIVEDDAEEDESKDEVPSFDSFMETWFVLEVCEAAYSKVRMFKRDGFTYIVAQVYKSRVCFRSKLREFQSILHVLHLDGTRVDHSGNCGTFSLGK